MLRQGGPFELWDDAFPGGSAGRTNIGPDDKPRSKTQTRDARVLPLFLEKARRSYGRVRHQKRAISAESQGWVAKQTESISTIGRKRASWLRLYILDYEYVYICEMLSQTAGQLTELHMGCLPLQLAHLLQGRHFGTRLDVLHHKRFTAVRQQTSRMYGFRRDRSD